LRRLELNASFHVPLDPLTRAGFTRGSLVFLAAHVSHLIEFVYDHDEEEDERDYQ
jgi:hypothetical protein